MIMPDRLELDGDVYPVHDNVFSGLWSWLVPATIEFGPYKGETKTGLSHGTRVGPTIFNNFTEHWSSLHAGHFEMQTPQGKWSGRCVHELRGRGDYAPWLSISNKGVRVLQDRVSSEQVSVRRCTLRSEHQQWQLFLDPGEGGGQVVSDHTELTLTGTYERRYEQPFSAGELAGYVISDANGNVAAIDTGYRKRVAFRRDVAASQRAEVAAVCLALLVLLDLHA